jgi:hypothetical protein
MPGPRCSKHPDTERIMMQVGKKKLWTVACPKCQAEKASQAGTTPPAAAPTKPAAAAPPARPATEKKRSFWNGW